MKSLYLVTGIVVFVSGCNRNEQSIDVSKAVNSNQIGDLPVHKVEEPRKALKAKPGSTATSKAKGGAGNDKEKPPIGLYEVKMSFPAGGEPGWTDVVTSFRWVRLYKNGTYTTSQSKHGQVEGRWIYEPKTHTITWKNRYTESDAVNDKHELWNNLQGDCQREGNLHLIFWSIRNSSQFGHIYLIWKKQ